MKNREELLIRVMHLLAEVFKTRIALEGGMFLRLLNCPRSTQDVDYVMISGESKKTLAKRIEDVLSKIENTKIESVEINSRGIFVGIASTEDPSIRASVEIKVQPALNLPEESISTAAIARQYSIGGRIISTVAMAEAFSNKIAAALERNSMRDLYDLSQLEPLCSFDVPTLKKRLAALSVDRGKSREVSFSEAAAMLKEKAARITETALERELYPLMPAEERHGLAIIIKAAVARIVARMEGL